MRNEEAGDTDRRVSLVAITAAVGAAIRPGAGIGEERPSARWMPERNTRQKEVIHLLPSIPCCVYDGSLLPNASSSPKRPVTTTVGSKEEEKTNFLNIRQVSKTTVILAKIRNLLFQLQRSTISDKFYGNFRMAMWWSSTEQVNAKRAALSLSCLIILSHVHTHGFSPSFDILSFIIWL